MGKITRLINASHGGGWPFRNPPNVAFRRNKNTIQDYGLKNWWSTVLGGQIEDRKGISSGTLSGVTFVNSKKGKVLSNSNEGNYVSISPVVGVNDTLGFVSTWVYFNSWNANIPSWYGYGDETADYLFGFQVRGDGAVAPSNGDAFAVIRIFTQAGAEHNITIRGSTTTLALNTWYNIITGSDGSNYSIFVNGIPQSLDVDAGLDNGTWIGDTTPSVIVLALTAYWYDGLAAGSINGYQGDTRYYNIPPNQSLANRLYFNPWELYDSEIPMFYSIPPPVPTILAPSNLPIKAFRGGWPF